MELDNIIIEDNLETTFGESLNELLNSSYRGSIFRAALAYVSPYGVKKIKNSIKKFKRKKGTIEIIAGINIGANPITGLKDIYKLCGLSSTYIFYDRKRGIFHPKLYYIKNESKKYAVCWIGSNNLTEDGFYNNYEFSVQIRLKGDNYDNFIPLLDEYFEKLISNDNCMIITDEVLTILEEERIDDNRKKAYNKLPDYEKGLDKIFKKFAKKKKIRGFVMTLSHNDVSGIRSEPYFLVPISARDYNKDFWGWNYDFKPSPKAGYPENKVRIIIYLDNTFLNEETRRIYWVEGRAEFRFVSQTIYNLGDEYVGNVLNIEKTDNNIYKINILTPSNESYNNVLKKASKLTPGHKKWGYVY